MKSLRIGSRGSPLALVQASMVRNALIAANDVLVEIVVIQTTGDVFQDRPLVDIVGATRNAGCHSPVAALSDPIGSIRARLHAEDGSAYFAGADDDATMLARQPLARAPDAFESSCAA